MEEDYIDIDFEVKDKNIKKNYIIRDRDIKESFSLEELLGEDELEKLKLIL